MRTCLHTEIYNTYCFSTATMVTQKRLSVTLYAHCLSCLTRVHLEFSLCSILLPKGYDFDVN